MDRETPPSKVLLADKQKADARVKLEVSSVKQERPSIESSDVTLQT
jgi:hypothetical protein